MKIIRIFFSLIVGLSCVSCASINAHSPTASPSPSPLAISPSLTNTPQASATVSPSLTPIIITTTPGHITSIDAVVMVESLMLRSGPSTVHPVVSRYTEGNLVSLVAREPGNQWVKVETQDNRVGWMLAQTLEIQGNLADLQIEEVTGSIIIWGYIVDVEGAPVDKINVAVFQETAQEDFRTDAISNDDGLFYAYLPIDSAGVWYLGVVGIGCTSRIVDSSCHYTGTFDPMQIELYDLTSDQPVYINYLP